MTNGIIYRVFIINVNISSIVVVDRLDMPQRLDVAVPLTLVHNRPLLTQACFLRLPVLVLPFHHPPITLSRTTRKSPHRQT